jgi:hypothetical protein
MTGPPTNTFTVTIADAHAHSVPQSGVPAASKLEAVLDVCQQAVDQLSSPQSPFASFVTTDTWTVTITQP